GGGARLAILLVAATTGFGNGLPLPAGPLRAPLEPMLAQSGLLILSGTALARRAFLRRWQGTALPPVQEATLGPLATGMAWSGLRAIVIARGDARPIAAALTGEGAEVLRAVALDQRGRVSAALCARLVAEARRERAQLVAGEAEAAALPPGFRSQVLTLPMRLTAADWSPLDAALRLIGAIP
ncbi:MAG: tetraacyldisaccharide 4'-kinase, partial [Alphaproteobacteria bacterium HGW-Alphaproteobacteria-2]